MTSLAERLHKWAVQELNLISEGGFKEIPDVECFQSLIVGKNKRIWNYVLNHVRSQSSVEKIKRTLSLRKHLREREDEISLLTEEESDDSVIAQLQTSISKVEEKRMFLMRKHSAIEETTLKTEQNMNMLNDEANQIHHKTAILDLLREKYNKKKASVNDISQNLALHTNYLCTYQSSSKMTNQSDMSLTYGFLYDSKINNGNNVRVQQLVKAISNIIEIKFTEEKDHDEIVCEIIKKNVEQLKDMAFLLTDLVFFLHNMSDCEKQQFTAVILQSLPVRDFMQETKHTDSIKQLLCQMKYENVQYALSVLRNKKKINDFQTAKNHICKNIREIVTDSKDNDSDIQYALFETLAENEALIVGNTYVEENLRIITYEAEKLKQNNAELYDFDLTSSTQKFYKQVDFIFYLLHTAPYAFNKILDSIEDLRSFVQNEIFQPQFLLPTNYLHEIKESFSSERKLMSDYCTKTNLIALLKSDPYNIQYPLSREVRNLLIIQPFENFAISCMNLMNFKEEIKLKAFYSKPYDQNETIETSKIYESIMQKLKLMRSLIEQSLIRVDDGLVTCERIKNRIQEWSEQEAQFIPHIEYGGKSLKMWVDILKVLDDFKAIDLES